MKLPERKSPRWKEYDYISPGGYFITICAADREPYFGNIIDGAINLSRMGQIIVDEMHRLSQIRPYIEIHEYIIMPDHIHILLVRSEYDHRKDDDSIYDGPILGNIIGSLKANITKRIKSDGRFVSFGWQSRYHDRIIRTSQEYDNIKYYIQQNPVNWGND